MSAAQPFEKFEKLLSESMEWADRAAIVDPLIRKLQALVVRRFNRQLSFLLKNGVPFLDGYFSEAPTLRKPPKSTVDNVVNSLDEFTFNLFDRTFEDAVAAAIVGGSKLADAAGLQVSFNLKSDPVLNYLRKRGAALVSKEVDHTTKDKLRDLLAKGYEEGWTRRQLVREIKGLYHGFNARNPIKHIGSRAELIAVTELGNAMSYGTLEGARSLQARGVTMEKRWALSSSACPLCQENAAQDWIPLEQPFVSGAMVPLGHVGCRCSAMTRAKPTN